MRAAATVLGVLILGSAILAQQKGTRASDEAALRALEDKWNAALLAGNANELAPILADTWVVTYVDGRVDNKAGELAALKAGTFKVTALKVEEMKISVYGDTGIVTGKGALKAVEHGTTINQVFRWTDVFVRQNGQWKAVATQGTLVK